MRIHVSGVAPIRYWYNNATNSERALPELELEVRVVVLIVPSTTLYYRGQANDKATSNTLEIRNICVIIYWASCGGDSEV